MRDTNDQGQYPETDAALLACYQRWREKCVTPEFDRVVHLVEWKPKPPKKSKRKSKK